MSDLNIVRLVVIQLCQAIRDLTCYVGTDSNPFIESKLISIHERCSQIEAELERP